MWLALVARSLLAASFIAFDQVLIEAGVGLGEALVVTALLAAAGLPSWPSLSGQTLKDVLFTLRRSWITR
jgi:hypothetical protein